MTSCADGITFTVENPTLKFVLAGAEIYGTDTIIGGTVEKSEFET